MIGADGGGSQVRQEIAQASGGRVQQEMLDHDYKELEIPPGPGGNYRLAPDALHIWPRGGFMLIALPNLDGSFTVTLFMPAKKNPQAVPSFEDLPDATAARRFFDEVFPSASELMPDLESDFVDNPTSDLGTIRSECWTSGDALILGDAAHAIVPFHGQGMNCGFEDCAKLIEMLDQHGDDWRTTARSFEQLRKPSANAIADMALENYVIMRDSVSDAHFQVRKKLGFALEKMSPRRFIPRYSMVMFHDIPYEEAMRRGGVQEDIMTELLPANCPADFDPAQIDMLRAKELIEQRLAEIEFAF